MVDWKRATAEVRGLQTQIVQAEQAGDQRRVFALQDRLVRSRAARLLAVRQVTTNNGRFTPGVDGVIWKSAQHKAQAAERLRIAGYTPQPARRVYIPKSDGRQRPLGILTMHDRAMQALFQLALDPVAETRADPHSYGFRKYRSTADAIGHCMEIFAEKNGPQWVLEADIEQCFDTISHAWLLKHIPLDNDILRGWLKAGYMEKGQFRKTTKGLPQGGIISPTLANMALDGMEELLSTYFHHTPEVRERSKIYVVRYADDFIVAGADKHTLQKVVKSLLTNFLQERGMRFSIRKTRLTHITQGFEFLGYRMQAVKSLFGGYALTVVPAPGTVRHALDAVTEAIAKRPDAAPFDLIQAVNSILRGWVGHYAHLEDREALRTLDRQVFELLLKWARQRHPRALKGRVLKMYFEQKRGHPPRFTDGHGHQVLCAGDTPFTPHVPIEAECNPYDPKWQKYLKKRTGH